MPEERFIDEASVQSHEPVSLAALPRRGLLYPGLTAASSYLSSLSCLPTRELLAAPRAQFCFKLRSLTAARHMPGPLSFSDTSPTYMVFFKL
jgi:hypothetical protein